MKRQWMVALAASMALGGGVARAADHRDGPAALADPTTDITDVYAWMSSDGAKAYLVMDVQGANTGATATTKFSNTALYVLHLGSAAAYNPAAPKASDQTIICTFDNAATQNFQCWGPGSEYVTGATGVTAGVSSTSGKIKVFAGLRDDPFYFNIRGFRATAMAVNSLAKGGTLQFDPAGCPTINSATSMVVVNTLKSDGAGGAAKDDFGAGGAAPPQTGVTTNGNVLSIVIAVDKTLITGGGAIVSVWGSTNMAK